MWVGGLGSALVVGVPRVVEATGRGLGTGPRTTRAARRVRDDDDDADDDDG